MRIDNEAEPVSYTHLDVYKRQSQGCKDPAQNPGVQLYHAPVLHDDLHRHHCVPDCQLPGEPVLKAVSYTHLLFVLGKSLVLKLSHRPTRFTCPLVPFIAAGFIPAYFL